MMTKLDLLLEARVKLSETSMSSKSGTMVNGLVLTWLYLDWAYRNAVLASSSPGWNIAPETGITRITKHASQLVDLAVVRGFDSVFYVYNCQWTNNLINTHTYVYIMLSEGYTEDIVQW